MANVGDKFPSMLEIEDIPIGGIEVRITDAFEQEALNPETGVGEPTWHLKLEQFPYKLLKVTPGRGKALVRLHGPETAGWLNKWIYLVSSTNPGPHGQKYIVVDRANQPRPPETPPIDLEAPPEEEE